MDSKEEEITKAILWAVKNSNIREFNGMIPDHFWNDEETYSIRAQLRLLDIM